MQTSAEIQKQGKGLEEWEFYKGGGDTDIAAWEILKN
jgi:hypothetical protein